MLLWRADFSELLLLFTHGTCWKNKNKNPCRFFFYPLTSLSWIWMKSLTTVESSHSSDLSRRLDVSAQVILHFTTSTMSAVVCRWSKTDKLSKVTLVTMHHWPDFPPINEFCYEDKLKKCAVLMFLCLAECPCHGAEVHHHQASQESPGHLPARVEEAR